MVSRAGALAWRRLGAGVVAATGLIAVAACGSSASSNSNASISSASAGSSASAAEGSVNDSASGLQSQYESVVASVLPSVVQIFTDDATGSGVVYDSKGDIVTNAHVVGDESTVRVVPATGGTMLTARVLGTFPAGDLAVIRVESDAGSLKVA